MVGSFPHLLSASTTLTAGSTNSVNVESLKNPSAGAMLIHELRWTLLASGTVPSLSTVDLKPSGALIGCALNLISSNGSQPLALTNGHVPVWNFGRSFAPFTWGERPLYAISPQTDGGNGPRHAVSYYWRPRFPIFVPAGSVLSPSLEHRGGQPGGIEAQIAYVVEALPGNAPSPSIVRMPWVSHFVSKAFAYNEADDQVSTELDLVNPHADALYLERLSGRIAYLTSATFGYEDYDGFDSYGGQYGRAVGSRLLRVRMDRSDGVSLVPIPTLFRNVFAQATRSWELRDVELAGSSFLRMYLTKSVPSEDADLNLTDTLQAFVGMVGWRAMRSVQ